MQNPPSPAGIPAPDLQRAARALRTAGLTETGVADAEQIVPRQVDAVRLPLVRSELARRHDAASLLVRLFVYDDDVAVDEARVSAPDVPFDLLAACGLIVREGDVVRATGRLVPFMGLLVAGDRPSAGADAVMPPGPTTQQLGQILPDEVTGRALDIATGPGSLALALAARGASVVGSDVSERALAFAAFNAVFNNLDVEWRRGSLLEPVQGQAFDVVVAQPPFIPQPDAIEGVTFLHSGPVGDEMVRAVLAGMVDLLAPGGVGLVRFDAPARAQPLVDDLRSLVPAASADLAVVTWSGPTAGQEAFAYATLADPALGDEYARVSIAYREHLRRLGIEQFVQAVALVRRSQRHGTWTAGLPLDSPPATGAGFWAYVAALDCASLPDAELAGTQLRPLDDLAAHAVRGFSGDEPSLSLIPGSGTFATVDEIGDDVLALLDAFAGGHAPAAVAAAHASLTGESLANSEALVLVLVRRALTSGWLVPV